VVALTVILLLWYVFALGWVKKRRHWLLICVCIISLLWLFFFCYYNFRTLSFSEKNLQHEFRAGKNLHEDTGVGLHEHRLYSDREQSDMKNDSVKFRQRRHNITNSVKEMRQSDFAQTSSLLYTVNSATSHIVGTEVSKNATPYTGFHENSAADNNLILERLQSDPSVQQISGRQNRSQSLLKYKLTEDALITDKSVSTPVKLGSIPLLSSGDKPSGFFEQDIRHLSDGYKRVVLSVIDSGYINFAINFQRLSIDPIGLRNFLFVCTDRRAVDLLQQHGIACSYFRKSIALQVVTLLSVMYCNCHQYRYLMLSSFYDEY